MAFSGNYMCTSFKKELLYGVHDFDLANGDTFKIALYDNTRRRLMRLQPHTPPLTR